MDQEKVAVIAVHGVGDPPAGHTAVCLARQLQHFEPQRFAFFTCTPVHIAVDTTGLYSPAVPAVAPPTGPGTLRRSMGSRARTATPRRKGTGSADTAFTAMALEGGEAYRSAYTTNMLRHHTATGGHTDLYEMFWADLSQVSAGSGWKVVHQIMQLFLHMASLGRSALATQLADWPKKRPHVALSAAYAASALAYWLLAVPILLGNLLLLCYGVALAGLVLPDTMGARAGAALVLALGTGTLTGVVMRALLRRADMPPFLQRVALPVVWLATVGTAVAGLALWPDGLEPAVVAFWLALALALAAASRFVRNHERRRPGVIACWSVILAVAFAWGIALPWLPLPGGHPQGLLGWFVYLVEGTFLFLVAAWALLILANICLAVAAGFAGAGRGGGDVQSSVTTALVAAALPAPLLLFAVLAIWVGAYHAFMAADPSLLTGTRYPGLLDGNLQTLGSRMERLIDLSASPMAIPYLVLLAMAFVCVAVGIAPCVMAELAPPAAPADAAASRGLGRWLDNGFRLLKLAMWLAVAGFFFMLPAGAVLQYVLEAQDLRLRRLAEYLSLGVGGGALAVLTLPHLLGAITFGSIARLFARLRVAIDIAIDVDNWLRERPVGETPRLHIMARYVSLLRHVRDQGYDRVVLVCHSQGTVITLDLLRYLKDIGSPVLQGLGRMDLLTFGSPLRQLYAARFPATYGWAAKADPAHAGLASWENGYGSGDYVGRSLWPGQNLQPWQTGRQPLQWQNGAGAMSEFCTGALAHTHYFDRHSRDVAAAVADRF